MLIKTLACAITMLFRFASALPIGDDTTEVAATQDAQILHTYMVSQRRSRLRSLTMTATAETDVDVYNLFHLVQLNYKN